MSDDDFVVQELHNVRQAINELSTLKQQLAQKDAQYRLTFIDWHNTQSELLAAQQRIEELETILEKVENFVPDLVDKLAEGQGGQG